MMEPLKQFFVLWTYIGNYSRLMPVMAKDAKDALERTCGFYNDNPKFRDKASVFVFDTPPAHIQYRGERMEVEPYREASRGDG